MVEFCVILWWHWWRFNGCFIVDITARPQLLLGPPVRLRGTTTECDCSFVLVVKSAL